MSRSRDSSANRLRSTLPWGAEPVRPYPPVARRAAVGAGGDGARPCRDDRWSAADLGGAAAAHRRRRSPFGVTRAADTTWLEARLTPHPLRTFTTSQTFRGEPGNGLPAGYILCNDPIHGPQEGAPTRARSLGWPVTEIATGHDAMVTAPAALVDMLEAEPER